MYRLVYVRCPTHDRVFKAMDANKDGKLSLEEMMSFMHGPRPAVQRQQEIGGTADDHEQKI
ncbi:EF-hand domain-containing protein [Xanthobacteraceae bacterium Astr-EGSB]|nr:EF-hand domain-containing protein [Xanthobacteraceae bacterium Astr-EGSB]